MRTLQNRSILYLLLILFAGPSLAANCWAQNGYVVNPYLSFVEDETNNVTNCIVISWIIEDTEPPYNGIGATVTVTGAAGSPFSVPADPDDYHYHITIGGLSAGNDYNYRVVTDDPDQTINFSSQFTTAPDQLTTNDAIVIYGCSRSQPGDPPHLTYHPEVVNAILTQSAAHAPKLAIHCGDIGFSPTEGDNLGEWKYDFFNPLNADHIGYNGNFFDNHLINRIPVMVCLGNHDVLGDNHAELYQDTFVFPKNDQQDNELYYSFDYGQIHFTILNTEVTNYYTNPEYTDDDDLLTWLDRDLANTEKPFRIVAYHYPGYLLTTYQRTYWTPLFETYHVQAVFRGHDHQFNLEYNELVPDNEIYYVLVGGGGSPLGTGSPGIHIPYVNDYSYCRLEYHYQDPNWIEVIPLDIFNRVLYYDHPDYGYLDFDIYAYDPPDHLSGELSGIIEKDNYYVDGDISVALNTTLTIDPGTQFFFTDDDISFTVYGALEADGYPEGADEPDTIKFRALPQPPGEEVQWAGITLDAAGTNSSIFRYCIIRDCDLAIDSEAPNVFLNHCLITQATNGIQFEDADVTIYDSIIEVNTGFGLKEVDPIPLSTLEDIFIHDCSFFAGTRNTSIGIEINGADEFDLWGHFNDEEITSTVEGFAVGLECNDAQEVDLTNVSTRRCVFYNNTTFGAKFFDCTTADLDFTQIDFIFNGNDPPPLENRGALYLDNSYPSLRQCHFKENYGRVVQAIDGSDALFGQYGDDDNGNLFRSNYYLVGHNAIIYENDDSYPLYNNRYNDFYQEYYAYYIYNSDLDYERNIGRNYWGVDYTEPTVNDFYPSEEGTYYWDPICDLPNIELDPESGGKRKGGPGSDLLEEGIQREADRLCEDAVESYQTFIATSDDVVRKIVALRRILKAAIAGGLNLPSLNGYYQTIIAQSSNASIIEAAYSMISEVKIAMGNYNSAIVDYEDILSNNPSIEDSVFAVIKAGRAYILRNGSGGGPDPQMPWLEPNSLEEYKEMRWELLCMLDSLNNANAIAGDGGIEGVSGTGLPIEYALHENHPNPFNPVTQIMYDLSEASQVKIEIFNIMGQKIYTLVDGIEPAGFRSVTWRGVSDDGSRVASGIYLYRLRAEARESGERFIKSAKMLLLQ